MLTHLSRSISPHVPPARRAVARVAAVAGVATLACAGTVIGGVGVAAVVTVAVAAVAAGVDARSGRIPNGLVVLAAAAMTAGLTVDAVHRPPAPLGGALLGGVALAGPLLLGHAVSPAALGFADVKLASVLGAAVGVHDARLGLVALCVATGLTAAVGLFRRRSTMPLGPGLVVGAAATLALAGGGPA